MTDDIMKGESLFHLIIQMKIDIGSGKRFGLAIRRLTYGLEKIGFQLRRFSSSNVSIF